MNPLVAIRQARELNRRGFAAALDVNYFVLMQAENGYPMRLPGSIRLGLERMSIDSEKVAEDYIAWRQGARIGI